MMSKAGTSGSIVPHGAFLVALALLLVNDLSFKAHFPGVITGKLSDFAGLYVAVQFLTLVVGGHAPRVAVATGILFVVWKCPLSTGFILWWNSAIDFPISRTLDYSDLTALAILPLATCLAPRFDRGCWRLVRWPLGALTIVAILGTSRDHRYEVRFDLRAAPGETPVSLAELQSQLGRVLVPLGFQCVECELNSAFGQYSHPPNISAMFNFDPVLGALFVQVEDLSSGAVSETEVDRLESQIRESLRPRFENITVRHSDDQWNEPRAATGMKLFHIAFARSDRPHETAQEMVQRADVLEALQTLEDFADQFGKVDLTHELCPSFLVAEEKALCRGIGFGPVIGPRKTDRLFHLEASGHIRGGRVNVEIALSCFKIADGYSLDFVAGALFRFIDDRLAEDAVFKGN